VSDADEITVVVCAVAAGTPAASIYDVLVFS